VVTAGAAALSVEGLAVRFGPVSACSGIDIELPEGAVGALVGTNGAGKSTILRALAGVIPSAGRVRLFGEDITGWTPQQRVRGGLVLAAGGRATFPSLTVEESLILGTDRPVEEALAWFPALAARRRQRAGTLSAGEQQLVVLARALVAQPRVLLVDELTLGLAGTVAEEVGRIVTERGTTLLVDQSITRALRLASRAWFLERGAIRFAGTPAELVDRRDLLQPVLLA
jgi:branched-chain amino acid transport system ATP-binding protein